VKSQLVPILLYLIAGISGAGGQYLYKLGAAQLGVVPLWKNWQIGAGVVAFTAVMVCFIAAFKLGGRLSVIYPMYATTFIWGALIGVLVVGEPWSWAQVTGIAVIVAGCILVAVGAPA
jgi:drug/metabolite transporter (DMT)-like permease